MSNIYIHHGASQYDPSKFKAVKNMLAFTKPEGGLWASPVDAPFGWAERYTMVNQVDTLDNNFRFMLTDDANVLYINSADDLIDLPKIQSEFPLPSMFTFLDFEQLLESGIDAIQVNMSNESEVGEWGEGLYWRLYGWDCDSILVMNKEIVVPI